MAEGIMANPKMRQLLVLGVIIGLILVMFIAMLFYGATEEEEIRSLEQKRLEDSPVTTEIQMADSDQIEIDGTLYDHPDKLYDIEEIWIYGTNESNPDTDGDGMEDGWEARYGKIDLLTGLLTIDPLRFDAFENPDGDGWDIDHNGRIEGEEHLTNLEEYCGGSFDWGPFKGHNLDPQGNYEQYIYYRSLGDEVKEKEYKDKYDNDTAYIQYHGGFHLIDFPYSELILDEFDDYPTKETSAYRQYRPNLDKPLTTDPSNSDTDFDGMSDGFELYFAAKAEYLDRTYFFGDYNESLDPLDPSDANENIDVKKTEESIRGMTDLQYIREKDNLTNLQEFQNGTDPTMYDSDDDSYFDQLTGRIQWMSDHYELKDRFFLTIGGTKFITANIDWDFDGIVNLNSNPNSPDSDGDFMGDGWEENFGLNPCNASDRFLDNDNDGLPNYLEFAYPNASNVWFRTMPNDLDTDDDGIPDGWEAYNTKVITKEVNAGYNSDILDGLADGIAYTFTVNPMIPDADLDLDGVWYDDPEDKTDEDIYHKRVDNLTNLQEYLNSINPNSPDTDGDKLTDGEEIGYYYCLGTKKTITWFYCDNDQCPSYGQKIPSPYCPKCGDFSLTTDECDSEIILRGGFFGKLLAGRWITDINVASRYFTNASSSNTDGDFSSSAVINESRYLDDWEEVNGMQHEVADNIDNDGDGEFGSPTTWFDINKDGKVDAFEVGNYASIPAITDETLSGGIFGAVADGIDNDGDGEVDEGIDEDGEGIIFTPTNASYYDTDHEGLGDVDEIFGVDTGSEYDPKDPLSGYGTVFTDPGAEDTDDDFLNDYLEITRLGHYKPYVTNPLNQDSDGDGLTDGREWEIDFYPLEDHDDSNNWDANGDGKADEFDNGLLVKGIMINNDIDRATPRNKDSDYDDLPDGWEYDYGRTNLRKFIHWHDQVYGTQWVKKIIQEHGGFQSGLAKIEVWVINPVDQNDKNKDPDADGLNNWNEYLIGTDPLNWDSDNDGLPDGWEVAYREFDLTYNKFNLDPSVGDSIINDELDDEDGDNNMPDADGYDPKKPQKNGFDPLEEILDFKDNDGDGEVVQFMIINGIKTGVDVFNDIDDDGDGYVDEEDEISFKNWIDDDGDGLIDEGIDEEFDLNDANEDYDFDGVWYTVSWIDDDGDDEFDEDPIDDDGDGRFNEDILDGIDNDGDGLIDEDTGGVEDDNDGDTKIDEDPKKYYHPFSNYMEYQIGRDKNGDGMNEFNTTTFPNDWDSDGDKMADGWEIWFTDYIYNSSNILQYQDNDSLPRGWEELFNGSLILFPSDYLPLGLQNGDDALKYVGKFNPDSDDSNENGVPDGEENYDNDEWQDPHHPFPEEAQIEACNNSAEYRGHSDPTDSTSTPQVEYRAIAESDPGSSINEGTGVGNINDELPEYKSLVQDEDTIILELSDEAEAIIAFEASQDKTSEAIDIKAPKSDF
jgi:hypothetical protein